MIVDLPDTTTTVVSKRLVRIREDVGAMALSRVLTLVLLVDEGEIEEAIATANAASHVHPSRIVAIALGNRRGTSRLDAQIRVGGDAGASEVIVLRLYGELTRHARSVATPFLLADSPIVVWWPGDPPKDPSGDPLGSLAQRRITDATRGRGTPRAVLGRLAEAYADGDSDLAWSRVSLWRALLAAALDGPPYEQVTAAVVTGAPDSPSTDLLAGWLAFRLRCPVQVVRSRNRSGVISVRLQRPSGPIDLVRPLEGDEAILSQPGQPTRSIALPHRSDAECLADELRRLDPDEVYEDALRRGLELVTRRPGTATDAVRAGRAPSPSAAKEDLVSLGAKARRAARSAMVDGDPESGSSAPTVVRKAARERLAAKERKPKEEPS